MRSYPKDEYDRKELARLEAPGWMLAQLKLNPAYTGWGPHEDYMWKRETGNGAGWDAPVINDSWKEFGPWSLDDLNEVVNFYFEIGRPSRDCETCGGKGRHVDAQWITESWYSHSSPFTTPDDGERHSKAVLEQFGCTFKESVIGRGKLPPDEVINRYGKPFLEHCVRTIENGGEWSTDLTQDEVDALWEGHRLRFEFRDGKPTAEQVNNWARSRRGIGHDAINSWICTQRRCERLGVPYDCPTCEGHGHLFTGPAYLGLVLWVLHPRKGCSRGVEVKNIQADDLPAVYDFLSRAARRNADRFQAVTRAERKARKLAGTEQAKQLG